MAALSADSPVFLSYSRRDYYFAESLALHLLKEGIPAWLDVKNLGAGVRLTSSPQDSGRRWIGRARAASNKTILDDAHGN